MSRFHHLRYHEHGDIKRDLVILIDEGDAGYHPEWQRVFFNDTLNFLSRLYQGYNLQLIFTANTPFLSSDLPKSHIVFIEKKAYKSSLFKGKYNDREETFGANIHTLYSNSFYMEGALIGEFAKEKINNVIKYLKNEAVTNPDPRIKKIIDIIGEPIVRRKLQDMWNTKFGLDEEIEMLRNRIAEIEKSKANDHDQSPIHPKRFRLNGRRPLPGG